MTTARRRLAWQSAAVAVLLPSLSGCWADSTLDLHAGQQAVGSANMSTGDIEIRSATWVRKPRTRPATPDRHSSTTATCRTSW